MTERMMAIPHITIQGNGEDKMAFPNFGMVAENVQPDAIQPKTHPTGRKH
jgi:hypothetical protein